MITAIGFDADDTLWHNETLFESTHEKLHALLSHYHDPATVERELLATELRNLELYGYGVKGFTLSAIETAIALSGGRLRAEEVSAILGLAKTMLAHPVSLLEGARETVAALSRTHSLLVITKGDLRDQERKFAASGLGDHFSAVEVLSEKDPAGYQRVLRRHGISPSGFLMVGNSLRSDIVPVLTLGSAAAHVPYPLTWAHERLAAPPRHPRFHTLASLRDLPTLLSQL